MYNRCLQVHDSVNELDGRVENLNLNQMYANDGLYALCRWVLCWRWGISAWSGYWGMFALPALARASLQCLWVAMCSACLSDATRWQRGGWPLQAGPLHVWVTGLTCVDGPLSTLTWRRSLWVRSQLLFWRRWCRHPLFPAQDSYISHLRALCCLSRALALVQLHMPNNSVCLQAKRQSHHPAVRLQCTAGLLVSCDQGAWPCSQC